VLRHLVLARIIEPTSKLDSLRVLDEAGVTPASYRTLKRRLSACARQEWWLRLSRACAAHAKSGPASLVLYDVAPCISGPARATASVSRGSPGNGAWNGGEKLPDVKAGSAGPADLPPQARLHRGPPDDRLRGPRRQQVDRSTHWLVNQERRHQPPRLTCALGWPDSGHYRAARCCTRVDEVARGG
jgi:hypothetical protein